TKVKIALGSVGIVFAVIFWVITNIHHHKCGDNVRWKLEGDTLRVYGEGAIYDYDNKNAPWNNIPRSSIKTIQIENGITTVGADAFGDCSDVTNIILPDTLRCIRFNAFKSFNESCQMELPDGLLVIEHHAIALGLTDLYIPGSVQFIDSAAFGYMPKLKNIRVDSDNDYYSDINGVLFNKDATALIIYPNGKEEEDYTIPDSVKTVAYNAFDDSKVKYLYIGSNCDLGEIWIDPNLDLLKEYSEEVYFGKNENTLTYPGSRNLEWSIKGIYVNNENNHYYSEDGVLFSKDGTILVWYPCRSEYTDYIVPYGVKEIAPYAFFAFDGSNLTSVDFPDTLSIIGDCAFDGKYIHVSEINIPDGVSKVGYNAFTGCDDLQYILFPSSLREVSDSPVKDEVEIHYNGTVQDWNDNVSVYKADGELKIRPVILYNQVICTDGIIK
ncbi:leucine-rich repeat domain-containing protein, partial [TM7 phylum sp. oral taxon 352]